MATVFFSYSHKDELLRNELEIHLTMLKRQNLIEAWHDRRIPLGDDFSHSIDAHLEAADIILLLVSPDFLASSYCFDVEVQRAMELHRQGKARIIPIILRPCDWQSAPFAGLLAAPTDGKPVTKWPDKDEAFLDIVKLIRATLPQVPQPSAVARSAQRGAEMQQASSLVRSSNLRIKKEFTEADRDRFTEEAFEYMARFFENSLTDLQTRNLGIETTFRRIDLRSFSAKIYRNGKSVAQCSIHHGARHFGTGITFAYDEHGRGSSYNESLTTKVGEQSLYLAPSGMSFLPGNEKKHLTFEGAAEYYWEMFIGNLQH